MTSSPVQSQRGTDEPLAQIYRFLLGSAGIDGVWFGEQPKDAPGFWWRNMLLAQLNRDVEQLRSVMDRLEEVEVDLDRKREQLRARDEEIAGLRAELEALKEWALGKGWSLATCFESVVVANQEKSRDAG